MSRVYKDYLVVEVRLGTTYSPTYRTRKFASIKNVKKWALKTEIEDRKLITVYRILHTASGVKLKSVY